MSSSVVRTRRAAPAVLIPFIAALLHAACGQSGSPADSGTDEPVPSSAATDSSIVTAEQRRAAEEFYRNQTVRIVVGSGAGGGFDTTARLVARHLARHIPGNPTVIVENMPGGGGLVAANHMFHAAPKNGLVIGIFHEAQVLNQLTGAEGVQFDLRKFNWLGSSYDDPNVCLLRTDVPVGSFKELIGSSKPVAVGGTSPGSNTYDVPRVLAAATGASIKAVAGYPTTGEVRVGIERGELQGMCFGWESAQSTAGQWLRDKYVRVVVQNGRTRHKDLPDVPLAVEFAKDDEARVMLGLVDAPGAMAKPFALPPGVDASRVNVLRSALFATYEDPALLEEAAAMNVHFQPKTAPEIQKILNDVLSTRADVVAKFKQVLAP